MSVLSLVDAQCFVIEGRPHQSLNALKPTNPRPGTVAHAMGGHKRVLQYNYDANGNRTHVMHPDQHVFGYAFDGLNRLDTVSENGTLMLDVQYQQGGGRWYLHRPDGATTTYEQDHVGRLSSFAQTFSGSGNNLTNGFSYNPASQVTFLSRSNDLYAFTATLTRTGAYVPNGLNQYTNINGQTISYDDNGNLTHDGSVAYTYDMENRLVAANGIVDTLPVSASFTWDPLGRLSQVTIDGASRQFLYDGDALVAEYSGATLTRRYVHGDQVDEPLVQYDSATVGASYRRYLHADHQGSIIAQSSNTGGVVFRNKYDPYGIPDANNSGRFGYTGQAWLKELGLYHYKARMYHPRIGRFLQTDPIFYADDMNMYAYVGGDPVNRRDPTGMEYRCTESGTAKTCEGTSDDIEAMRAEMKGYLIVDATSGFFDLAVSDKPEQTRNTVVTDGEGGMKPFVGRNQSRNQVIRRGAHIHEEQHIRAFKAFARNLKVLQDQPEGLEVHQVTSAEYAQQLKSTLERHGFQAEKKYLVEQLRISSHDQRLQQEIMRRIRQVNKELQSHSGDK